MGAANAGGVGAAGGIGEGGRGIGGFEPVEVDGDFFDVGDGELVGGADVGHQFDDGAVVAGGGVDFGSYMEQFPTLAEVGDDGVEGYLGVAAENIGKFAAVVAGEGVVKAGVSFEGGFGAADIFPGEEGGHNAVAGGVGFVEKHFPAAAARPFGGAAGKGASQGDGGH